MILHAGEDIDEVIERVDPARLAGGDERVQAREALAGSDVADEEVVLPSMRTSA
jgi:hypothetical protein